MADMNEHAVIFAWKEDMGDVWSGEWSPYPDEDGDPPRGEVYVREARLKQALTAFRETFCLALPGSDAEFHSFLQGFDAAVAIVQGRGE